MSIADVWAELVTVALLGTDRREPPAVGIDVLADTIADAVRPDAATRMLDTVAVVTAARRAAFVPLAPTPALQTPDVDDRPLVAPEAVAAWRRATGEWPVLDDEWLIAVIQRGDRLPADALVELLDRSRCHPGTRARVMLAGGPVAAWVIDQYADLASAGGGVAPSADQVLELPPLPMPPELAELVRSDAHTFVKRLSRLLVAEPPRPSDRAVLTNLFARCRPGVLIDAADALEHMSSGVAHSMADLCRARHHMLATLE